MESVSDFVAIPILKPIFRWCMGLGGAFLFATLVFDNFFEQAVFGTAAACLMGGLENMALWSSYADLFIASEELEPGNGWDYTALSALNSAGDSEEAARAIVAGYGAFYLEGLDGTVVPRAWSVDNLQIVPHDPFVEDI